jgi:hypothetical protein
MRANGSRIIPGTERQVLLLSMRRLANLVAYCTQYEFEDLIAAVTGADRVEVGDWRALELSRRAYKLVRRASGSRELARRIAPSPSTVMLDRNYELFFPFFNHTHELYALASVPNWRVRCRVAVCYINEVWAHLLPEYLIELLSRFDHIFLGTRSAVEHVAHISGRPCSYLPLAVDVVRFSPWPDPPARSIDVCNIGRRSQVTHEALVRLASTRRIFYYFDTFAEGVGQYRNQRTFRVASPDQHRLLLSNLLRRTRYYIANRSRINDTEYANRGEEISTRFYEGAAAGAVMLGEPPNTPEFTSQFGWPDAVIRMPFDSPDVEQLLRNLDDDPERLARIERDNFSNAALQHDWVYRLRSIFAIAALAETPAMLERERLLRQLADQAALSRRRPAYKLVSS